MVGKKELASNELAVRRRIDGKQYSCKLEELANEIDTSTVEYPRMPLKLPLLLSERPAYKQLS